jgi:type I restriction enzyme S subunit
VHGKKDATPSSRDEALTNVTTAEGKWRVVQLGEIAEVKLGKMLDKAKHKTGRPLPYLRNVNVRWGTIETDDLLEMNFEEDELERFGLNANDVLVCEGGEPGRASVWNGRLPDMKFQKALHRVRFKVPFDPRVLVYLLELLAKTGGLERRFTGSTIKHFTRETFVQLPIPYPPITEQRRIVAEIEKQFTRLDAGVATLWRLQANLKRYRAALFKAACEGSLVANESQVAKGENCRIETGEELLARITNERCRNAIGRVRFRDCAAPDFGDLEPLPDGWAWATVEQLAAAEANAITDGPFGSNLKTEHYTDSGPRVIRLQNIGDGVFVDEYAHISSEHFRQLDRHRIFANEIVIAALAASPPRSCVVPASVGPAIVKADCIRFKPHPSVSSKFINIALNSDPVRRRTKGIVHGVGRPRLNLSEIKSIILPLPPVREQTRIVAEVDRRLSMVQELHEMVSANLKQSARLRQSILERAFYGISPL